jgi:outer membrane protein OmpA-like peptidoglycan-associated protein
LTGEIGPGTLGASVGGRYDPAILGLPGAEGGGRATFGASAGVLASDEVGLGLEVVGRPALVPAAISGAGVPVELMASTRYRNPIGGFLVAGGAVGLTDAVAVPTFRLFVGGGFAHEKPPRPLDFDPIGPLHSADQCPLDRETVNGWRDDDGCPDQLGALLVDVRYEGQPVEATAQITGPDGQRTESVGARGLSIDAVPGTQWSITASDGCLVGAGSALVAETATPLRIDLLPRFESHVAIEAVGPDGAPVPGATASWTSEKPACVPQTPVFAAENGRIRQDVGSGLKHVLLVTAPGYTVVETPLSLAVGEERALRIELRPTKIKLESDQIVILEKVQFDTGRASIKKESFGLLDEVAATILAHPEIGRVEVAGHTDNQGSDTSNLRLSQDRAASVRQYLLGKGVAEGVLIAKGYGEAVPIDTNRTEPGRERNRRVEFKLIDHARAKEGGTP